MSPVEAYVSSYGHAVNDSTSLWTKNAFSKLMDLSDTFLQVDGPLVHFTLIVCLDGY
jgi:hypothetical protein